MSTAAFMWRQMDSNSCFPILFAFTNMHFICTLRVASLCMYCAFTNNAYTRNILNKKWKFKLNKEIKDGFGVMYISL